MKLNRIIVQIHRPKDDYVGQVEEGQYTCEDDTVMLVSHAGVPLRSKKGDKYEQKLNPGDPDAHTIAGRLLRRRYQDRTGDNKKNFSRPLVYPKWSY